MSWSRSLISSKISDISAFAATPSHQKPCLPFSTTTVIAINHIHPYLSKTVERRIFCPWSTLSAAWIVSRRTLHMPSRRISNVNKHVSTDLRSLNELHITYNRNQNAVLAICRFLNHWIDWPTIIWGLQDTNPPAFVVVCHPSVENNDSAILFWI